MITAAFWLVMLVIFGVIVLHVAWITVLAGAQPGAAPVWAGAWLAALVAVGLMLVWRLMPSGATIALKAGAISLYLAAALVYMELRSVLSRGYSLRILLDLLDRGEMPVSQMPATYSNGLGVRGMLERRARTLALLRCVRAADHQIGPLTRLGRWCAKAGVQARRFLKMETVG